jgi:Lon protease-like protein
VEGTGDSGETGRAAVKVVPLFPLPDVWLFPGVIMPLNVFEERYVQMVEDCLDGPGRIVLGTIRSGHETAATGDPPIYPLAGLGEIGRHERKNDGRYEILLVGLQRVFVREVDSDRLYRRVEMRPVAEKPIDEEREPGLRKSLIDALEARTKDVPKIPDEFSTSHLIDMLVLRMPLTHGALNGLYAELDVEKRARKALAVHFAQPGDGG